MQSIIDEHDRPGPPGPTATAEQEAPVSRVLREYLWCWVPSLSASATSPATRTKGNVSSTQAGPQHCELVITIAFEHRNPDTASFASLARLARLLRPRVTTTSTSWLAIGSTIIQIPAYTTQPAYPWLTIFQLARFLPCHTRDTAHGPLLLFRVWDHAWSREHAALPHDRHYPQRLCVQLLRGDLQGNVPMKLLQIFTSFLRLPGLLV